MRAGRRTTKLAALFAVAAASTTGFGPAIASATSTVTDRTVSLLDAGMGGNAPGYTMAAQTSGLGARSLWRTGITGSGIDVAVIDSGVEPVAGLDADGKVLYGPDMAADSSGPADADVYGHGTHMAGIIAGNGNVTGSPADDTSSFIGVAPDARIVSVKVAGSDGTAEGGDVVRAIDWVVHHRHDPGVNIRVVNLSLGEITGSKYNQDDLAGAVERAWKAGLVVVAAAGNEGWQSDGLSTPAFDPYVVAVGAADTRGTAAASDDTVARFSSSGDKWRQPDLVAPGVQIPSLRVPDSVIDGLAPVKPGADPRFVNGNGSSQAAAFVSGAAALLLQQRPNLTPDQVKALLVGSTARLAGFDGSLQGNGEFNVARAARLAVPADAVQTFRVAKSLDDDTMAGTGKVASSGVRWSGVRWSGVRWSGVRWSGVRWSGNDWG